MNATVLAGFWDNLKMATGALRANKMRSLLTTLAIIMGVATIVAIVSVIDGLNTTVFKNVASIGGSTIYVQRYAWASEDWVRYLNRRKIGLDDVVAVEKAATEAAAISPSHFGAYTVKAGSRSIDYVAVTGATEAYADVSDAQPEIGRFFTRAEAERARPVAVIGATVADELFGPRNPIGEAIRIDGEPFKVIGVLSKRGDFFDMNLDVNVVVPFLSFRKAFGANHSLGIMLKPRDPTNTRALEDQIVAAMRRVRKLRFGQENDFAINKVDILTDLYRKLTGGLYAAMFAVGAISLVVGGIGIMNIMLVSVTERTREIGVRMAIGAKRRFILYQFLTEAVTLCGAGGILGILAGFGLALAVSGATPIPARVQPWSVLLGLAVSTLTGTFFGIFPAIRASRLDPIDALRYE